MKETIIVNYEGDKRTDSIGYSAIKQWKLLLESPCCDPDSTDSIQQVTVQYNTVGWNITLKHNVFTIELIQQVTVQYNTVEHSRKGEM